MASERALVARIRKEHGLQNENTVPDSDIQAEIVSAKSEITEEVRQRLETGATLSFEGEEEEALTNLLNVRVGAKKKQKETGKPNDTPGRGPPETVSAIRRHDFADDQLNFWRDRMVSALSKIQ